MKSKAGTAAAVARMEPLGVAVEDAPVTEPSTQPPAAAVALRLSQLLTKGKTDLIYIASSERRAEETARALSCFAPQANVLCLPPWDCLPYDRAVPSRESMGLRMAALRGATGPADGPRILVTSPDAAIQKVPPKADVAGTFFALVVGEPLDRAAFEQFALRTGYVIDDRVDEPGEIALRGNVVEVFPAAATAPVRVTDEDGIVTTIMRFDPRSQLSTEELTTLEVGPASELVADDAERGSGGEHRLGQAYGELASVFDYLPDAAVILGEPVANRIEQLHEQVAEAYATACDFADRKPPVPGELYLEPEAWSAAIEGRTMAELDLEGLEPVPDFFRARSAGRALTKFVGEQLAADRQVLLCGVAVERKQIAGLLKRQDIAASALDEGWSAADGSAGVRLAAFDLEAGFADTRSNLTVIAAADVFGSRLHEEQPGAALLAPVELRVGDVVVHEDHGVAVLRDLTRIETEAGEQDTIRLEYYGGASLLVPTADFGKLWRYGAEAEAVTLDRLNTDAWAKKRATVSAEIDAAAAGLAELAEARLAAKAEPLRPPKAPYQRLAARFPYPETPDQATAIAAVLDDLASGRQMNRLICGDVGFGKTEVALRAAAAAALAGRQVAVIAPTTVLARQHLQSFERRFAGTDITVGHLSRLDAAAEMDSAKEKLRTGEMRIVVATQAIAAEDVEIPELGLVIIDEEQRFGAKLKRQIQTLAEGVHLLSMSATPIPRTLQAAMVGLQDVSIIATPPARRRPIRTFVAPFDAATARTALLREKRRQGQSFVVVPRIEDIASVTEELARIVPDLTVNVAHGGLSPKEIDTALLAFANGEGDILLATNIVESGLDVPRANTMLIWRADRFGLSQLHQLRGRVGRSRMQGVAYLFTDPESEISDATKARLSTLEAFDRLGAGFEISARDLELRGAGDLLGEEQAGHVHLIGAGLYQQLLEAALSQAKGGAAAKIRAASLNLGLAGTIPVEYVPEAVVRINLYARLQRLGNVDAIDDFATELEDRFGQRPAELETLLAIARLGIAAGQRGIAHIDAGPRAIALTPIAKADATRLATLVEGLTLKDNRLVWQRGDGAEDILADLGALLAKLAPA